MSVKYSAVDTGRVLERIDWFKNWWTRKKGTWLGFFKIMGHDIFIFSNSEYIAVVTAVM